MRITNLGNNETQKFTINFKITNSAGGELSGKIPYRETYDITPPGEGPYTVRVGHGSGGFSQSAKAEGVLAADQVSYLFITSGGFIGPAIPGTGNFAFVTSTTSKD